MNQLRTLAVVGALAMGLALASCGRPGLPRLPQGVSDTYPAGYPRGAKAQTDGIFSRTEPSVAR